MTVALWCRSKECVVCLVIFPFNCTWCALVRLVMLVMFVRYGFDGEKLKRRKLSRDTPRLKQIVAKRWITSCTQEIKTRSTFFEQEQVELICTMHQLQSAWKAQASPRRCSATSTTTCQNRKSERRDKTDGMLTSQLQMIIQNDAQSASLS